MCLLGYYTSSLFLSVVLHHANGKWFYSDVFVSEGEPVGFNILRIVSSNRSTVSYDISGDYTDEFSFDPATGNIYLSAQLDWERKSEYIITARSFDEAGNRTETPVSFYATVIDENDEKPRFTQPSFTTTIEYGQYQEGQTIMTVNATDEDDGKNGIVSYSILPNSDVPPTASGASRFKIDSATGAIQISSDLDESVEEYRFTVEAIDGGIPRNAEWALVVVKLAHSNNSHAPKFSPVKSEQIVSELTEVGTTVYSMIATDEDKGVNKMVYFEIVDGDPDGTFEIVSIPSDDSPSIGSVKLRKGLDYESRTAYALTIKAYNRDAKNADDPTYSTTVILNIVVRDANEPPVFSNTPYVSVMTEENTLDSGLTVVSAKKPVTLILAVVKISHTRSSILRVGFT